MDNRGAVLALRLLDPIIADADVDPAVDAHADAVGRVIAAANVDLVGRQAGNEHLLPVGDAVAVVVVEDTERRRVHDPDGTTAICDAARMLDPGEHGHIVHLAVTILVHAAEDPAAAGGAAERALFID